MSFRSKCDRAASQVFGVGLNGSLVALEWEKSDEGEEMG